MLHIAILESERTLAESLMGWLEEAGHQYTCCSNLTEFMACVQQQGYDLFLLDFRCRSESCFQEIEAGVLDNDRRIPLLFIGEPDCEEEIVLALAHGADDYMVKPFELQELVARLRVLSRRRSNSANLLEVADLCLNTTSHQASRNHRTLPLSPIEWKLLEHLMRESPNVVTRHQLETLIWKDELPSKDALKMQLYRLRQIIDGEHEPPLLHTIRGAGVALRLDDAR